MYSGWHMDVPSFWDRWMAAKRGQDPNQNVQAGLNREHQLLMQQSAQDQQMAVLEEKARQDDIRRQHIQRSPILQALLQSSMPIGNVGNQGYSY